LENKKGKIDAITAAMAAYKEEEEKAERPAMPKQRSVMVSI
jgi:hypothetical protein